jgi:hypothetical protein
VTLWGQWWAVNPSRPRRGGAAVPIPVYKNPNYPNLQTFEIES